MVTVPEVAAPEPTREERAVEMLREAVAGAPNGAIRRIMLYLIALALVVSPIPVAAVIPLMLLAMTDVLA